MTSSPLDFTIDPPALERLTATLCEVQFSAPPKVDVPSKMSLAFSVDRATLTCLREGKPVVHFSAVGMHGSVVRDGPLTVEVVLPDVNMWLPSGRALFAPKCRDAPLLTVHFEQSPRKVCVDWAQVCILVLPEWYLELGEYARETFAQIGAAWKGKTRRVSKTSYLSDRMENALHNEREDWLQLNFGVPLLLIPTGEVETGEVPELRGEELLTFGVMRYWRVDLGLMKITPRTCKLEGVTVESVHRGEAHLLMPTCGQCTLDWSARSIIMSDADADRPSIYINAHRVHISEFFTILDLFAGCAPSAPKTSNAFHFFAVADIAMDIGFTQTSPLAHICVSACSLEIHDPLPLTLSSARVTIDDRRLESAGGRLVDIAHGAELQIFQGTVWKVILNEPWIRLYPQLTLDLSTIFVSALDANQGQKSRSQNSLEFIDFSIVSGKICLMVPGAEDFVAINISCDSDIRFTERKGGTTHIEMGVEMRLLLVHVRDKIETPLGVGRAAVHSQARLKLSRNLLVCNVDKLSMTSVQVRLTPRDIGLILLGLKQSFGKDLPTAEPLEEIIRRIPLEVRRDGLSVEMTLSADVPCADVCVLDDRVLCPFVDLQVGLPLLTVGAYMKGGSWDRISLLAQQARGECSLANCDNGLWEPFVRPFEASVQFTMDRQGCRASFNMEDRVEVLLTDTARTSLFGDFLGYAKGQIRKPFDGARARIGGDVIVYNLTTENIELSGAGCGERSHVTVLPGHHDALWGRDERLRIASSSHSTCVLQLRSDVFQSMRPGKDESRVSTAERRRSTEQCMSAFATRGTMYDGAVVFPQPNQKVVVICPAVRLVNDTDMELSVAFMEPESEGRVGVVVHANVISSVLSSEDRQGERGNTVPPKCAFLPPSEAIKWHWSINGCEFFDPCAAPDMFRLADGRTLKLTKQRGPAHFVTIVVEPPMVVQNAIPSPIDAKITVSVPWVAYPDADTMIPTASSHRAQTLSLEDARKLCAEKGYAAFAHDRAGGVYEFKGTTRADVAAHIHPAHGKTLYVSGARKELVVPLKAQQARSLYDPDLLYTPQVALRISSHRNWSSATTLSKDYGTNHLPIALGNHQISMRVAKKKHKWTFLVEHWFVNATGISRVRVLGRNLAPLPTLDDVSFVHMDEVDGEAVMRIAIGQEICTAILPVLHQHAKLGKAVLLRDRVDSTSTFGYVYSTVWTLCPPLAVHNDLTCPVGFGTTILDAKSVTTCDMQESFVFQLQNGSTPSLPLQVRPACYHLTVGDTVCSVEVCDKRGIAHVSIRPPSNRILVNRCRYVAAAIEAQHRTYECAFGERVPFGLVNPFQNATYVLRLKWIQPVECELTVAVKLDQKWTRFFALPHAESVTESPKVMYIYLG